MEGSGFGCVSITENQCLDVWQLCAVRLYTYIYVVVVPSPWVGQCAWAYSWMGIYASLDLWSGQWVTYDRIGIWNRTQAGSAARKAPPETCHRLALEGAEGVEDATAATAQTCAESCVASLYTHCQRKTMVSSICYDFHTPSIFTITQLWWQRTESACLRFTGKWI